MGTHRKTRRLQKVLHVELKSLNLKQTLSRAGWCWFEARLPNEEPSTKYPIMSRERTMFDSSALANVIRCLNSSM